MRCCSSCSSTTMRPMLGSFKTTAPRSARKVGGAGLPARDSGHALARGRRGGGRCEESSNDSSRQEFGQGGDGRGFVGVVPGGEFVEKRFVGPNNLRLAGQHLDEVPA